MARSHGGQRPGAGRPRLDADGAILGATRAVLRRVGFQRLTVEEVAKQAQVSPGTIYRRWPTKTTLAVAAYRETIGPAEPVDTGSLHGDLEAFVDHLVTFFTGEHGQTLASLMTSAAAAEASAMKAIRQSTGSRRKGLRTILERARDRGELPAEADIELIMDVMLGPLWTRLLVTGQRITKPLVRRIVHLTAGTMSR